MATVGQVIFRIMIVIIIILVAIIAILIGISVAGNKSINDVTTVNAVGQIGEDVILACTFTPDLKQYNNILWQKVGDKGIVYQYENGKVSLTNQNSNFKDRASLFLNQVPVGNASLKITNVQIKDAGAYKCTISNSNGSGEKQLSLGVGAFSAVTVTNTSETTLRCSSPSWLPQPTVSWLNVSTETVSDITNFSTTYVPGLSSMVQVISDFSEAEPNTQYRCVIQNNLARAEVDSILTVTGLKTQSRLDVFSSAPVTSPSQLLLCLLILIFHLGCVTL